MAAEISIATRRGVGGEIEIQGLDVECSGR